MKYIKIISIFILLATIIASCAPKATETPAVTEEPVAPEKKIKVALVLSGVISDASWNASAYEGLMAAEKELGVEGAYSESVQQPEFEAAFRDYANKGYDIVIGHGSEFGDAALVVAKEFPNTYFAITNSDVKAANVAGLDTKNEESGYIAGFIAGTLTKTKKVGYVGSMEIVGMLRGAEGFQLGVKAACPDCEALIAYTGSFDDIAKGKETALALYDNGADIIWQYADASGLGVIDAAKAENMLVIGMGTDQTSLAPDNMVTSTIQHLGPIIVSIVKEVQDGSFTPNTVRLNGYDTGAYELAPLNKKLVTPEQEAAIMAVVDQLVAGQIELPHLSGQ